MSDQDKYLLEQIISQERVANARRSTNEKYFEIFSAEQALKNRGLDLDPEQIQSGIIGGGDDGGVDSIYLFANRRLIREDSDIAHFKGQQVAIELVICQATYKASFTEVAITRLQDFTDNCLKMTSDHTGHSDDLYHQALLDTVSRFHSLYKQSLRERPTLAITYYYASLGQQIHPKVKTRSALLEKRCKEYFSAATVAFKFIGAAELWALFNQTPTKTLTLVTNKSVGLSSYGTAYVCLVPLRKYFEFINDGGALRGHIFESNVRDFEGDVSVNKGIGATLATLGSEEFWWLNNGITIIASEVVPGGDDFHLTDALIVNGLQTSYVIHNHFSSSEAEDDRHILVRIIKITNPESADRIIMATNSQTKITKIWLHATEDIHRKIESALRGVGLFYDRRKNFYRNQGKPSAKIVTLPYLSQAVAAIVLQKPDDARARPTTVADRQYASMFSEDYPIELYNKCALLMKRIDEFLDGTNLDRSDKNNIKFYLAMYVVGATLKSPRAQRPTIATLEVDQISDATMKNCLNFVWSEFETLGGDDQVAKGPQLVEKLKGELRKKFGKSNKMT